MGISLPSFKFIDRTHYRKQLEEDLADAIDDAIAAGVNATGDVVKADFTANSILKADTNATPSALTVAASRILGRKASGGIDALTAAEAKAVLAMTAADVGAAPSALFDTVNVVAATGPAEELPLNRTLHDLTMDENCTLTFPTVVGGHAFTLVLRGAFTPTFPASVKWSGGTPPTYATPAMFTFTTVDAGVTWLGSMVGSTFS